MNIKEVALAMQGIEFVLHSLKNGDRLNEGELEFAHKEAQKILEQYLVPNGALKD